MVLYQTIYIHSNFIPYLFVLLGYNDDNGPAYCQPVAGNSIIELSEKIRRKET